MDTSNKMMKLSLAATLALTMVACGGGGDSTSGGGSSAPAASADPKAPAATPVAPKAPAPKASHVGNYKGTQTFVLTKAGKVFPAESESLRIEIKLDNSVSYTANNELLGVGKVSGSSIKISIDAGSLFNQPGTTCVGTFRLTGSVNSSSKITGSIGSSGIACNGEQMSYTGSFNAGKL